MSLKSVCSAFVVYASASIALASAQGALAYDPSAVECNVQLVHANGSTTDIQPETTRASLVTLRPSILGGLRGSIRIPFAARPSESVRGYDVDVDLALELERSTWVEGAPRLTAFLRVRDAADGRVLASHEDHSDKIIRDRMVESLRKAGPRVVFGVQVPEALARLEAITNTEVVAMRRQGLEAGFRAAARLGLIPSREATRFDLVCTTRSSR